MNKAFLAGKIYDVIYPNEYSTYRNCDGIAIAMGDYIYPIRNTSVVCEVGAYPSDYGVFFVHPETDEDKQLYSLDHMACFGSADSLKAIIAEQEKLESDQMKYLISASSDNIFKPVIDPMYDSPLMIGFKQAVIDKNIDINKYASRFGTDFNNDRRKFNSNKISLDKFVSIGTNLDMKATLIIEDANKKVPNPIGHKIVVNLFPNEEE